MRGIVSETPDTAGGTAACCSCCVQHGEVPRTHTYICGRLVVKTHGYDNP